MSMPDGLRTCLPFVATLLFACSEPGGGHLKQGMLPECAKDRPQAMSQRVVFFDHNSDELTDRAKSILRDASAVWRTNRLYSLEIYGHTDTSELQLNGRSLGSRRATAVKQFLSQAGISERVMIEHDLAAARLLVPTKSNTPEPQNRFVDFYAESRGSVDTEVNKLECLYWLRKNFCAPLVDRRDANACNNALSYL